MVILGVDISAGYAYFVILSGTRKTHSQIASEAKKIALTPYPAESATIKAISDTINALLKQHAITDVVFKKYPIDGKYTSGLAIHWQGALVSKLSGQLHFVASQTITATNKKHGTLKKYPSLKYLGVAYDLAFEVLK